MGVNSLSDGGGPENITISRETPIIIQNPHFPRQISPPPDSQLLKKWSRILIPVCVVLSLAFALAIVLVVLAALGYIGKLRVVLVPATGLNPSATTRAMSESRAVAWTSGVETMGVTTKMTGPPVATSLTEVPSATSQTGPPVATPKIARSMETSVSGASVAIMREWGAVLVVFMSWALAYVFAG